MSQFLCFVYMSYSSCYYLLVLYTCLTPAVFGILFQNHEGLVNYKSIVSQPNFNNGFSY